MLRFAFQTNIFFTCFAIINKQFIMFFTYIIFIIIINYFMFLIMFW